MKGPDNPKSIEAQDRSPMTLTIGDNVTALTNMSITIQCPTSGLPTPTVTWTKDGQEIPSGGRYKVQDDGSLVISEADEDDKGQYTCTADSVAGKDSKSTTVRIVGRLWCGSENSRIRDSYANPRLRLDSYANPRIRLGFA